MELAPLPSLRLLVQRSAEATAILGLRAGEQPLVLPTAEWFPDAFTGDVASLEGLVARMQGYAGLEECHIEVGLLGDAEGANCGTGGCGSGGCAPKQSAEVPQLLALPNGFRIEMPAASLGHSIAMTATIARMLGHIRLARTGRLDTSPELAELTATALGFGVLLLEASHIYSKSCGGPSVGRATALGPAQLALPFALFLAREGHKPRHASAELSVTQRTLLDEAWAVVQSNRSLVERLTTRPSDVAAGEFSLVEARSWLSRVFGRSDKSPKDLESQALAALERGDDLDDVAALLSTAPKASTRARSKSDQELKQLVDEAFSEIDTEANRVPAE